MRQSDSTTGGPGEQVPGHLAYSPSWALPGPLIFTASDPSQASGRKGVGTELLIMDTGDGRPDWRSADGAGVVYQVEGGTQDSAALDRVRAELGDATIQHRAIVTTLGVDPTPFLELGVTTCLPECYLQSGPLQLRAYWQAGHDGWPFVWPAVGVYDGIALSRYVDPVETVDGEPVSWPGLRALFGEWAGYLAEGFTDTASWVTLAALSP